MTTMVLACLQLADVLGGLTGSKLQVDVYADQVLSAFQKEPHVDEPDAVHPIASSSASLSATRLSGSMNPHLRQCDCLGTRLPHRNQADSSSLRQCPIVA